MFVLSFGHSTEIFFSYFFISVTKNTYCLPQLNLQKFGAHLLGPYLHYILIFLHMIDDKKQRSKLDVKSTQIFLKRFSM